MQKKHWLVLDTLLLWSCSCSTLVTDCVIKTQGQASNLSLCFCVPMLQAAIS